MSAPIINPNQSVLGYLQHQRFSFQPYASGSPTWWTSSVLPDGITLNPYTGLISGAARWPGVYVFSLQASNAVLSGGTKQVVTITPADILTGGVLKMTAYDPAGGYISIFVPGNSSAAAVSAAIADAVVYTPNFTWDGAHLTSIAPGPCAAPQVIAYSTGTLVSVTAAGVAPTFTGGALSDPAVFTMGIEASAEEQGSSIEAWIDLSTREINFDNQDASATASGGTGPAITAKRGDDVVFLLRFVKGGSVVDLDLASLKFGLKEVEPDNLLIASDAWTKTGELDTARYKVHVHFASDALTSALSNYEADLGTFFTGLGEFEWVENTAIPVPAGFPSSLRATTRTFQIGVVRDLIPDA